MATDPAEEALSSEEQELAQLRSIMLAPQAATLRELSDRLESLEKRITNNQSRAHDVSEVLAEAVSAQHQNDKGLGKALKPIVVDQFRESSREDPEQMAEALFPILGPAVRKMIVNIISPDKNTKKKRGYQVEQLFLIDKVAGLPVCHVASASVTAQDADLVSGMLNAIQSFVREAFETDEFDGLNTLQLGELSVWIEWGPNAVLAAVVRGAPPETLRDALQIKIEQIHKDYQSALRMYDGDSSAFEPLKPDLTSFLDQHDGSTLNRLKSLPKRLKTQLMFAAFALACVLAWWINGHFKSARWEEFVENVEAEPGIVITNQRRVSGGYKLTGLRDPLAKELEQLLAESTLDAGSVEFNFEPYQATHDDFILKRVEQLIRPTPSISLSLKEATLIVTGATSVSWMERTKDLARSIVGVNSVVFIATRSEDMP